MNTENQFKKGQEVWVKASVLIPELNNDDQIYLRFVEPRYEWDKNVHEGLVYTTEQILQEHGASAPQTKSAEYTPDFVNKLQVGDKVQLVERWGRKPNIIGTRDGYGFELNGIYFVKESEDYENDVCITNGDEYCYVPFIFLDLVEPAPGPKYFIEERHAYPAYIINYGTPVSRKFVAHLNPDYVTLAEAQEFCNILDQKDQDNENA